MLPLIHKLLFFLFALIAGGFGERVDALLRDGNPVGRTEVLADRVLHALRGVESGHRHGQPRCELTETISPVM